MSHFFISFTVDNSRHLADGSARRGGALALLPNDGEQPRDSAASVLGAALASAAVLRVLLRPPQHHHDQAWRQREQFAAVRGEGQCEAGDEQVRAGNGGCGRVVRWRGVDRGRERIHGDRGGGYGVSEPEREWWAMQCVVRRSHRRSGEARVQRVRAVDQADGEGPVDERAAAAAGRTDQ